MSWWDWLRRTLFGDPQRDVSRLERDDPDAIRETVDTSGKPLKEGHRRRALRDPRLLPKKQPLVRLGARKPVFSREEARRLFSDSLRTRNRNLRDLLPDEEQLRRFGLPVLKTEEEIARLLGCSLKEIRFYSVFRKNDRSDNYVTFRIPKKSGGSRLVMAPKRRLKELQRQLLAHLVAALPVSDRAHGFRAGRSIRTGAEPHLGKAFLLHFDIRDFFPSLHFGRVRGYLIAMGYGYPIASVLAMLMTAAERQPVTTDAGIVYVPVGSRHCVQGAPTSPGLANAIFYKVDRRFEGLARDCRATYTRYADDLSFSTDEPTAIARLLKVVPLILEEEGFAVNAAKTRIMRACNRQTVTGVVVNRDLGLSRQERRRLRAEAHRLAREAAFRDAGSGAGVQLGSPLPAKTDPVSTRAEVSPGSAGSGSPEPHHLRLSRLRGKLAYLAMLNPAQAEKLRGRLPEPSPGAGS